MDDVKRVFDSFSGFVRRMSASQVLMLLGVTAGSIAGLVVFVNFFNSANYSALYSGLDESASGEVIAYLDDNKIPYQLSGNGATIMVPDDQVYKTRMSLAAQGLPGNSTAGYSIFDKTNFGMTDFLQKLNYKRALEGELTRTIMEIHEVKAARVHIVIPKERLFAKDKKETTASILVDLAGGELSRRQLAGIKHLVASSVEGLMPSNISIIDYGGNLLSSDQDKDELAGLSSSQLEIRKEVERYLEQKAQSMLDGVIGRGKSVVRITAELDFTQVERTNELYDGNGAVVRSEERSEGSSNATDKAPEESTESAEDSKTETTVTNYEIPRTVEKIINHVGVIKRLSLAVLLDGSVEAVDDGAGNVIDQYTPRSQEEIDRLSSIVRSAVGFDSDRNDQIEVYNIEFDHLTNNVDADMGGGAFDMFYIFSLAKKLGLWALVIVGLLWFKKKAGVLFRSLRSILPPPPPRETVKTAQAIIDDVQPMQPEHRKPKLLDQMQETAKDRPDELAKVIKTMMVGGAEE